MNFAQYVRKWGLVTPDAPAVALGKHVVHDYASLAVQTARLASGLQASGLKPGDRIGLLMKNIPAYFECLLACWHGGFAAVPINAKLHARETAFILEDSGTSACFTSPELTNQLEGSSVRAIEVGSADFHQLAAHDPVGVFPTQPTDLAWLFYTSGTTGRPKGAMITHRNLMAASLCYLADVDTSPPWHSILHPAPLSHGSGLYALPHLMKGSCQVVPESGGFDASEIFDMIDHWPNTVFFAAPTMIRRLTAHPIERNFSGLKSILYGGAPMLVADVKSYLDRFGPRLAQIYGQGESPMTITALPQSIYADRSHPKFEQRIGSAGFAQSVIEVQTVDERGTVVPVGDIGEVICRGDSVIPAYWNNPQASARALRDNWLWTGDMGSLDEDGFLTLKDRSKDMIISGGTNIYPREIEEVLQQHPGVAEVSVIGRPDDEWGEIVIAYVAWKDGCVADQDELNMLCLNSIARFKRPKYYRHVASLPKNNYGKILKTELRKLEESHQDSSGE
ncbi:MAG: AMP-binding protein [Burkholderiaceae bacterium]